jgi:hypothetical protein
MGLASACLGWPPREFWRSTPHEFWAAFAVWKTINCVEDD